MTFIIALASYSSLTLALIVVLPNFNPFILFSSIETISSSSIS